MLDFLLRQVQALPYGTLFTVKSAYGDSWLELTHGQRRTLGKVFMNNEDRKRLCEDADKDSSSIQQYIRT